MISVKVARPDFIWGPAKELMLMDGYDDCIVGIVERYGQAPIVCYSKPKILDKLMADGMTAEEAEEFWAFNQIGAWMGELTPCFLSFPADEPTSGAP